MPLGQQQRRVARRQLEHVPDFLTGQINAVYTVGELPSEPYPHAGTASNDSAITNPRVGWDISCGSASTDGLPGGRECRQCPCPYHLRDRTKHEVGRPAQRKYGRTT